MLGLKRQKLDFATHFLKFVIFQSQKVEKFLGSESTLDLLAYTQYNLSSTRDELTKLLIFQKLTVEWN